MIDRGMSVSCLDHLRRRCETRLDRDVMVYQCLGRDIVVLVALSRWTGRVLACSQIHYKSWMLAGRHARRAKVADMIQRVTQPKGGAAIDPKLPTDFCERFPLIAQFLTQGRYSDGSPRRRSAVTVMAGEVEGFRAVLNDQDNTRSLWATAKTAEGVFVALEALLGDPGAPWRDSRPPNSRR